MVQDKTLHDRSYFRCENIIDYLVLVALGPTGLWDICPVLSTILNGPVYLFFPSPTPATTLNHFSGYFYSHYSFFFFFFSATVEFPKILLTADLLIDTSFDHLGVSMPALSLTTAND